MKYGIKNNPTKQAAMSKIKLQQGVIEGVNIFRDGVKIATFEYWLSDHILFYTKTHTVHLSESELEDLINHLTELKNKMQ